MCGTATALYEQEYPAVIPYRMRYYDSMEKYRYDNRHWQLWVGPQTRGEEGQDDRRRVTGYQHRACQAPEASSGLTVTSLPPPGPPHPAQGQDLMLTPQGHESSPQRHCSREVSSSHSPSWPRALISQAPLHVHIPMWPWSMPSPERRLMSRAVLITGQGRGPCFASPGSPHGPWEPMPNLSYYQLKKCRPGTGQNWIWGWH